MKMSILNFQLTSIYVDLKKNTKKNILFRMNVAEIIEFSTMVVFDKVFNVETFSFFYDFIEHFKY
jgi:hypothetical protein